MKVERDRAGNKYTFTPEDEKDEKFLDRIAQLEEENKKLNSNIDKLKKWIYQNVRGGPRIDYQEFCKKNGL